VRWEPHKVYKPTRVVDSWMRIRRSTALLLSGFTVLLSAVAALVIRQARGDDLDSTLWMNALLIFVGLLILTRATLGPSATVIADRCAQCGGRTFETARSLDRNRVRTCFSCGNENAAPATKPGPPANEATLEPGIYPERLPSGGKP
jgi:hypothetical protein